MEDDWYPASYNFEIFYMQLRAIPRVDHNFSNRGSANFEYLNSDDHAWTENFNVPTGTCAPPGTPVTQCEPPRTSWDQGAERAADEMLQLLQNLDLDPWRACLEFHDNRTYICYIDDAGQVHRTPWHIVGGPPSVDWVFPWCVPRNFEGRYIPWENQNFRSRRDYLETLRRVYTTDQFFQRRQELQKVIKERLHLINECKKECEDSLEIIRVYDSSWWEVVRGRVRARFRRERTSREDRAPLLTSHRIGCNLFIEWMEQRLSLVAGQLIERCKRTSHWQAYAAVHFDVPAILLWRARVLHSSAIVTSMVTSRTVFESLALAESDDEEEDDPENDLSRAVIESSPERDLPVFPQWGCLTFRDVFRTT